MIPGRLVDSDMVILNSIESYLKNLGAPAPTTPQEKLMITQHARDYLYSDIAQRLPRVASFLLTVDENDDKTKSIWFALKNHCMDPAFVNIAMQLLLHNNNPDENHIVGAFFVSIADKYLRENPPKTDKKKKEEYEKEIQEIGKKISHLSKAAEALLVDIAADVKAICPGLSDTQLAAIAGAISFENETTIREIVDSDLPITADIFRIYQDPGSIIRAALLLKKKDYAKLTDNQQRFIDSLKEFVYDKLNILEMALSYRFIVSAYGTVKPDVTSYLIYLKDCGSAYPNLKEVANQLINQ